MAERPKGYGMTAELADKKAKKFDAGLAKEAHDWIVAVTGEPGWDYSTADNFAESLRDGTILCKLINTVSSGSNIKFNTSKMAFKQMENIGKFLSACEDYGLAKLDLFQTVDLYEKENVPQVINGIHALGRKAGAKGFNGPTIGPKESTENKREFTKEQLEAGKDVIGLQMGSNRGASQAGITPYGLGRQINKTNLKN